MGGIAIVAAALVGWLAAHIRQGLAFSDQAAIVWVGVLFMAAMGFLDDYIKVRKRHNRGIFWKQKNYVTLVASMLLGWWLVAGTGISETISVHPPGDRDRGADRRLGAVGRHPRVGDDERRERDRRARRARCGVRGDGVLRFALIAYWLFRNPDIYPATVNPLDMGVMSAAFAGGCLGFLWWNAAPARIFMGDVGALAIGSALAFMALTTNTSVLLALICGINVMEAGSVAIQMGVFKASGRQASPVPDVADPSPLRAERLARDDGDHPLLADLRDLCRVVSGSSSPTSPTSQAPVG